jgi:hypothetical protein
VSETSTGNEEKDALPRDKKVKQSEQDPHRQSEKSTHFLEARRSKVRETSMDHRGKAHTN